MDADWKRFENWTLQKRWLAEGMFSFEKLGALAVSDRLRLNMAAAALLCPLLLVALNKVEAAEPETAEEIMDEGKQDDPDADEEVVVFTGHSDESLQHLVEESLKGSLQAREALVSRRDPRILNALVEALDHPDAAVRYEAVNTMKLLKDARLVPALIDGLKSSYPNVREAAAWALLSIADERALEPLIALLTDSVADVRAAAAWALYPIPNRQAVAPLIKALHDPHPKVRIAAADSLGALGYARAVEPLIGQLRDVDASVRAAAAWALGKIGDKRAVPALSDRIEDDYWKVRLRTAWSLGNIGDKRATTVLIEATGDDEAEVRQAAASALQSLGEPLGVLIHNALKGSVKAQAELGRRIAQRAVPPLLAALGNPDPLVRHAAARTLGALGDVRGVEALSAMAGAWDPRDRLSATIALFHIKQKQLLDYLVTFGTVIVQPASIVYLICVVALPALAIYRILRKHRKRLKRYANYT